MATPRMGVAAREHSQGCGFTEPPRGRARVHARAGTCARAPRRSLLPCTALHTSLRHVRAPRAPCPVPRAPCPVPRQLFALLSELQSCMAKLVPGIGGLQHSVWRSFHNDRKTVRVAARADATRRENPARACNPCRTALRRAREHHGTRRSSALAHTGGRDQLHRRRPGRVVPRAQAAAAG